MSNTSLHPSAVNGQDPQDTLCAWADAVKTLAGTLQTQDRRAFFRAFQCASRLYPEVQAILRRHEDTPVNARVHVREALDLWQETAPKAKKWLSDLRQQLQKCRTQRRILHTYRQKDRRKGRHVKLFAGSKRTHGSA